MLKYFLIQRMKKEGASHLPAPPVGRSCLDDGPVPTAPPTTSMVINQYICIFLNHIRHHTHFKSSYVHIHVFHILHPHTMKLLLAFKLFLHKRLIVEFSNENWFSAGCHFGSENWLTKKLVVKTG